MKIRYRSLRGYKYQLLEDYQLLTGIKPAGLPVATPYLELVDNGLLKIWRGYAWDGPSGPAIDSKNFMRGALVHDAFYQLIREGLLPMNRRVKADSLLRRLCLEDGMSHVRAVWVWSAVRAAGWMACRPSRSRGVQVLEAP